MLVTTKQLMDISESLGEKDWMKLGRCLQFTDQALECLEVEFSKYGQEEIKYQMLRKWKEKEGLFATKEKLFYALKRINRNDLCEIVQAEGLKKIQAVLKRKYKLFQLPRDPWFKDKVIPLDTFFAPLTLKEKNWYGDEIENASTNYKNLFHAINGKTPRSILIEGDPGYGKTTLVSKLASDWYKDIPYIKHFSLVFVIYLRFFKGNLKAELINQCKGSGINRKEIEETLQSEECRTLLLLDGYDELKQESQEIISLLKNEIYPEMTVVLTSRTEELPVLEKPELNHIDDIFEEAVYNEGIKSYFSDSLAFWDKRVQIKSIPEVEKDSFLSKYLKKPIEEISKEFPYLFENDINDLLQCPMFLFYVALVVENNDPNNINNKTKIMREIFFFMIRRNLYRNNCLNIDGGNQNFFDLQIPLNFKLAPFRLLLTKFSLLVFNKLYEKHKMLYFTYEEISNQCSNVEDILKMGVLMKRVKFWNNAPQIVYEPVHDSILYFLSGFYPASIVSYIKNGEFYSNTDVDLLAVKLESSLIENEFVMEYMEEVAPEFIEIFGLIYIQFEFCRKQFLNPPPPFWKLTNFHFLVLCAIIVLNQYCMRLFMFIVFYIYLCYFKYFLKIKDVIYVPIKDRFSFIPTFIMLRN